MCIEIKRMGQKLSKMIDTLQTFTDQHILTRSKSHDNFVKGLDDVFITPETKQFL